MTTARNSRVSLELSTGKNLRCTFWRHRRPSSARKRRKRRPSVLGVRRKDRLEFVLGSKQADTFTSMQLHALPWQEIELDLQIACAELWEMVWPTGTGDTNARLHKMETRCAELAGDLVHMAFDHSDRLVAVARTFEHTISYGSADLDIMGLASVCSDPNRRGEGYGDGVVRAAFERVEAAQRLALFQTPAPEFYERFGSRLIENNIVTSKPGAKPFADPWAMIHPGLTEWDDDVTVDLRIAGW